MIGSIGATDPTQASAAPPDTGPVTVEKEAFLKLLVAQIGNQDPLQPQDSDQYMQQITQFSMLEQLMNVNSGLGNLAVGQAGANSQQALRFIGKEIVATGDTVDLEAGGTAEVRYRAGEGARTLTFTVTDEDGDVVRTEEVPAAGAGMATYTWDGRTDAGAPAPAGRYRVSVEAKDPDGQPVGVDTYVRGTVTGVRFDNGYPELLVGDRRLRLGDVLEVNG